MIEDYPSLKYSDINKDKLAVDKIILINYVNVKSLTADRAKILLNESENHISAKLDGNFIVISLPSDKDETFIIYNGYRTEYI